eukprot:PhM_4_TR16044/c0_g1_i1/m.46086
MQSPKNTLGSTLPDGVDNVNNNNTNVVTINNDSFAPPPRRSRSPTTGPTSMNTFPRSSDNNDPHDGGDGERMPLLPSRHATLESVGSGGGGGGGYMLDLRSAVQRASLDPGSPTTMKRIPSMESVANSADGVYRRMSLTPRQLVTSQRNNEITFEQAEDIVRKEDLLIRAGQLYRHYGCPAYLTQRRLQRTASTLDVKAKFLVFPTTMLVSFGETGQASETLFIETYAGYNLHKLELVDIELQDCAALSGSLLRARALPALSKLDTIMLAPPIWSNRTLLCAHVVVSGCNAISFFRGNCVDACVAAGLGLFVGLMDVFSGRISEKLEIVAPYISCAVCGCVARLVERFTSGSYYPSALSGMVWLLPGWGLTAAVMDLAQRQIVTGSTQLINAVFKIFLLAMGMSFGSHLALLDLETYKPRPETPAFDSEWWTLLFTPVITICYGILMFSNKSQLPPQVAIACIGVFAHTLIVKRLPVEIATTTAAFIVGMCGNLYASSVHRPSIIPVINAMFCLVPGGLGVRGAFSAMTGESDASGVTAQVVTVALSLSVGVFLSNLFAFSRKKRKLRPLTL